MLLKSSNLFLWVMVLGSILCTYPFVFNLILPLPSITLIMLFSFFVFILLRMAKKVRLYTPLLSIVIVQIFGTILSMLVVGDIGYYKQILYIVWGLIAISFISQIGFRSFLYYYNRLILVVAILGMLSFMLSMVAGPKIFLEFNQMDGREGWLIYFTFTNTQAGNIIRYAGLFDEPGAMAFWGVLALLTNKIYVKDVKIEIPLIISLLFTFSLAYIIQLSLYLFFFYIQKGSLKLKLLTLTTVIFSLFLFLTFVDKDSLIYQLTLGRLGIGTSVNFLEGNNRNVMMDVAKKMFISSPFFGIGTTAFYAAEYAADNPYETLAKDGIIGTVFLYLPLIRSLSFARKNKEVLFVVFILFVGYLQRPFHINILHYIMIYLVLISSSQTLFVSKKD